MSYAYSNSAAGQGYPAQSMHGGSSPYLGAANPAAAQRPVSPYHGAQQGIQPSVSPYSGAGAGLIPPGQGPAVSSYAGMHGGASPVHGPASPYHGVSSAGSSTIVGAGSPMPGAYPGVQPPTSPMPGVPPGGQLTIGPAAAAAAAAVGAGGSQPFAANVKPGALTFTTTVDAQGRTVYHNFRAEQATYTSPQGVTYTGIQWIPFETSFSPPGSHIPPAGPDVLASFRGQLPGIGQSLNPGVMLGSGTPPIGSQLGGGMGGMGGGVGGAGGVGMGGGMGTYPYRGNSYHDDRWERDEQKRLKKEAKEAAKREAKWESERISRERAEEKELRRARELDARREEQARMRRLSNATGPVPMPMPPAGGYNGANAYDRERERDRDRDRELERRMGDMSLGAGGGLNAEYGAGPVGTRSRRQSMSMPDPAMGAMHVRPGAASAMYDEPDGYDDGYVGVGAGDGRSRRNSAYLGGGGGMGAGMGAGMGERSPYRRGTQPLEPVVGPDGYPVYPPGHILEGQPMPAGGNTLGVGGAGAGGMSGGAYSRSHSPVPGVTNLGHGGGMYPSASPRVGPGMPLAQNTGAYGGLSEQQMLASPEAFNRPLNRAMTFTPFETMKVQDMDDFLSSGGMLPRLPPVLTTHDVMGEDWIRLMNDLALAWEDRLPLPPAQVGHRQPKRTTLVSDLLELWNDAFFNQRSVELVLYKGRERYSGRFAGRPEYRLPRIDDSDSYTSDSDSDDSDLDSEEVDGHAGAGRRYGYGALGYGQGRYDAERIAAEQREAREYRRQRRKDKKQRRRERKMRKKEHARRYSLYMCYVPSEPEMPGYTGIARSARSVHSGHGGY